MQLLESRLMNKVYRQLCFFYKTAITKDHLQILLYEKNQTAKAVKFKITYSLIADEPGKSITALKERDPEHNI